MPDDTENGVPVSAQREQAADRAESSTPSTVIRGNLKLL